MRVGDQGDGREMMAGMFGEFIEKAKARSDCERRLDQPDDGTFRHLQVRLTSKDAKAIRCQTGMRDLSIQDALVLALNNLLLEWGELPISNPGTAKKKTPGK